MCKACNIYLPVVECKAQILSAGGYTNKRRKLTVGVKASIALTITKSPSPKHLSYACQCFQQMNLQQCFIRKRNEGKRCIRLKLGMAQKSRKPLAENLKPCCNEPKSVGIELSFFPDMLRFPRKKP